MLHLRRAVAVAFTTEFTSRSCQLLRIRHIALSSLASHNQSRSYVKIYTKTGDKGTSATFTGERRPKDNEIFQALGATDELNSAIGLSTEFAQEAELPFLDMLLKVQCMLQDVGSSIATPLPSARQAHLKRVELDRGYLPQLEQWIDEMTAELPPLKNFIIPSGGKTATSLHLARAICRRAERSIIPLVRNAEIDDESLRFLNRLSDFLFTLARFSALKEGKTETIYKRPVVKKES